MAIGGYKNNIIALTLIQMNKVMQYYVRPDICELQLCISHSLFGGIGMPVVN